jgi:hypothetical protein
MLGITSVDHRLEDVAFLFGLESWMPAKADQFRHSMLGAAADKPMN